MKTILITGAAGFIGSNLVRKLLEDNQVKILCLDNFVTGNQQNLDGLKNIQIITHNVIEPFFTEQKIDEIYHLASPASPPQYQKDSVFTFRTNVWGTYNFLELAKQKKAKFLLASTSEVYGDPLEHPQKEKYWGNVNPVGVRSCYDEGKRASETLTMDYHRQFQVDIKIIRIFNTYGPFMDPKDGRVVSNFINQALKNEDLTIYGDGNQTRSFQYIEDLISGMILMMASEKNFPGPVNLGNPNEFSIKELSEKVLKLVSNSRSKIVYKPLPKDDPKQRKPDISVAKNKLSWEPKIELEEGLKKTVNYFRNGL